MARALEQAQQVRVLKLKLTNFTENPFLITALIKLYIN